MQVAPIQNELIQEIPIVREEEEGPLTSISRLN